MRNWSFVLAAGNVRRTALWELDIPEIIRKLRAGVYLRNSTSS